jgi:hypothetical protein
MNVCFQYFKHGKISVIGEINSYFDPKLRKKKRFYAHLVFFGGIDKSDVNLEGGKSNFLYNPTMGRE